MSKDGHARTGVQGAEKERRMFPRIQARCPVRYSGESFAQLGVGELRDYSAGGVRMVSECVLLHNSQIRIELMPEPKSRVPRITADAVVVRCGMRDDHRYEVACRLTRVRHKR